MNTIKSSFGEKKVSTMGDGASYLGNLIHGTSGENNRGHLTDARSLGIRAVVACVEHR